MKVVPGEYLALRLTACREPAVKDLRLTERGTRQVRCKPMWADSIRAF